jgi:hypothetical protein
MKPRLTHNVWLLFPLVCLFVSSCKPSIKFNDKPITPPIPEATATLIKAPTYSPKMVNIIEYFPPEEFVGYYTESFEVASFVPCSENNLPGYGKGYWIDIFRNSIFPQKYYSLIDTTTSNSNENEKSSEIVFVHFFGKLSNPAYDLYSIKDRRGHMGLYKQEILVTELIEMEIMDNQCNSLQLLKKDAPQIDR